jgi:hypothetical protein
MGDYGVVGLFYCKHGGRVCKCSCRVQLSGLPFFGLPLPASPVNQSNL